MSKTLKRYIVKKAFHSYEAGAIIQLSDTDAKNFADYIKAVEKTEDKKVNTLDKK